MAKNSTPDIIVHIGLHKTGTSSIQKFLYENRKELLRQGIVYECPTKAWPNHHAIATGIRDGAVDPSIRRFLTELVNRRNGRTILFSSEMFVEARFDVETFIEFFDGLNVKVLAYLRNPCDQLVSSFNEVVRDAKVRWTRKITEPPYAYDPSYFALLEKWLSYRGLVLCPFDPGQWPSANILKDFSRMIAFDPTDLAVADIRENVSLSAQYLEVVRSANRTDISEEARTMIIEILRRESSRDDETLGYPFSVEQCQRIISQLSTRFCQYEEFLRPGVDWDFLFKIPSAASPQA